MPSKLIFEVKLIVNEAAVNELTVFFFTDLQRMATFSIVCNIREFVFAEKTRSVQTSDQKFET